MNLKELRNRQAALLSAAKAENRTFTKEEQSEFDTLQTQIVNAVAMIDAEHKLEATNKLLSTPEPQNAATPRIDVTRNEPKWKNVGELLQAVAKAKIENVVDPRLVKNAALGINESTPAEGGFLVEEEMEASILKRTYDSAVISSRCDKTAIGAGFNRWAANYINETSRATGSRMGGVRGYWIPEAGTITASMPTLARLEMKLSKLGAIFYATEEQLEDATALSSEVPMYVGEEFAWLLDDAILNGNGAGLPLGINNSASLVSVAKESGQAAATIVYENIVKMWSRMWAKSRSNSVWFINQDCEPQLLTMGMVIGSGGIPVYMPAGGISQSPFATLFGRPVIPIEQCATCGTAGDIILADMSQYKIIDKGSIKSAESIHVQFLTDQRAFRFTYRVNGMSKWTSALTPANGTNTLSPFVRLAVRA